MEKCSARHRSRTEFLRPLRCTTELEHARVTWIKQRTSTRRVSIATQAALVSRGLRVGCYVESDSVLVLWPFAATLCFEGGGFQLGRGDPSFEFCVSFFALVRFCLCVCLVLGVASPVVVLFVVVQLDSTLHPSKQDGIYLPQFDWLWWRPALAE